MAARLESTHTIATPNVNFYILSVQCFAKVTHLPLLWCSGIGVLWSVFRHFEGGILLAYKRELSATAQGKHSS